MKKVLIIANLFHASPRIPGLVKYLPEYGWEPTILTVPIGGNPDVRPSCRYLEVPYKNTVKSNYERRSQVVKNHLKNSTIKNFLYNQYQALFSYPDAEKEWKQPTLEKAVDLLKKEQFDMILSSSSPVTCHLIAKELKIHYHLPWVADLRDLWTQNHNYPYGMIRKLIERHLEINTLSYADALITVSQPDTDQLRRLHKKIQISTITNGFDPEQINKGNTPLTSKFTIIHTGKIYQGKQDLSKFFQAIRDLLSEKKISSENFEVQFYGSDFEFLNKEANNYDITSVVKIFKKIPRQTAFEKQRESQLLLLPTWGENQRAGHGLKLFEYLAAMRPVLAIGQGNDTKREVLEETGAGVYACSVEDIKKTLIKFYIDFTQNGYVPYTGDKKKINKYSYYEMAKNFTKIFNSVNKGINTKEKIR